MMHNRSRMKAWITRTQPHRIAALAIVVAFILIASIYSVVTPLWEAPDELGHFAYVIELARYGRLPMQEKGGPGEAHQPPLYYMLGAIVALPFNLAYDTAPYRYDRMLEGAGMGGTDKSYSLHGSAETFPWEGTALAFHAVRLLSVAIGAGTVLFTMLAGWLIFPRRRSIGALAGALVAFNPQFLFLSGSVNNDNLLNLAMAALLYESLRILLQQERMRQWVVIAIWSSVAVLTKLNIVTLGVVVATLLIVSTVRKGLSAGRTRSIKRLATVIGIIGAAVVVTCGWWFIRNQIVYGDPLGWNAFIAAFEWIFRKTPPQWGDVAGFFSFEYQSFWGMFGWINIPSPSWVYLGFGVVSALGALGCVIWAVRQLRARSGPVRAEFWLVAFLAMAFVVQEAYMLAYILRFVYTFYQGRYLFIVIAPIMLLLSLGLHEILPKLDDGLRATAIALTAAAVALYLPFGVIRPAYTFVPAPKWTAWFAPNKTNLRFGPGMELIGYGANLTTTAKGKAATLTTYWRAAQKIDFDYSTFAHVLNGAGEVIAQQDQAPGQDRGYPPSLWETGDIIIDTSTIVLPPGVTGDYRIRLGAYNYLTGARLGVSKDGSAAGDFIVLDKNLSAP